MRSMVVTLAVSKLSGWLNALASCRESKEGHAMHGEVRARRREGVGPRRCKRCAWGGLRLKARGPGHARSARRTCMTCL
eukprot:scaffold20724_cov60-Phaeocystis_antarctica.AAC.2